MKFRACISENGKNLLERSKLTPVTLHVVSSVLRAQQVSVWSTITYCVHHLQL